MLVVSLQNVCCKTTRNFHSVFPKWLKYYYCVILFFIEIKIFIKKIIRIFFRLISVDMHPDQCHNYVHVWAKIYFLGIAIFYFSTAQKCKNTTL